MQKRRVTFHNKGMQQSQRNKTCWDKRNKDKRIIQNGNFFVVLSLSIWGGSTKEIWPLQGFFTVSLLLVDLHLDKILLFLRNRSRMSKVDQEFQTEIMEIKVAEINAPLMARKLMFTKINATLILMNFWNPC